MPELLAAFEDATGRSLQFTRGLKPTCPTEHAWSAPDNPGVGVTLGPAILDPARSASAASVPAAGQEPVRRLGSAVGKMLEELLATRHALWEREAELAAGVPVLGRPGNQKHLAARLEAVLRGGAQATRCHAAAVYLLDESTSNLKLRSSWGLPPQRLLDPPRPLRGAMADLEAMLGHAIVLEDAHLFEHWRLPEEFAAAVCVPIATPTTVLGTLWVYSRTKRAFTDHQTNILEVVAGRIAADLEREVLLKEGVDAARLKRQLAAAERIQRIQTPTHSPLLDGWEIAGWSPQDTLRGDFYDWFCLPDGMVGTVLGDCPDRGLSATLSAAALRTCVRSHGHYHRNAAHVLNRANLTLWTSSAGDQAASVFYGLIDTRRNRLRCASAGELGMIHLRAGRWRSTLRNTPLLGSGPETAYTAFSGQLEVGDVLMILTRPHTDNKEDAKQAGLQQGVAELVKAQLSLGRKRSFVR